MNIAKIQKDLETITDVVLMQELRDTSQALQVCQQKLQLIQGEMNRRIEAHIKITGDGQPPANDQREKIKPAGEVAAK